MVNLASVILVTGIGLAIFFRKDITGFLESLRGFGQIDLPDLTINIPPLPDLPPLPPEIEQIPKEIATIFTDPAESILSPIFEAGVSTRTEVDKTIFQVQQDLENTGERIKTEIGEIELGLQNIFTAIQEPFVNLFEPSEEPQPIQQRKAGIFGGQTEPKMILTQTEATEAPTVETESTIIEAQQPDLSLVSPFLTGGTIIEPEPTRGELRFN